MKFAFRIILAVFVLLIIQACVASKESKRIKRGSKVIRDSEILLKSNFEGPASFYYLHLRKNNFFDYYASAMFAWEYYAGTWQLKNDTIYLNFIDDHKRNDLTGKAYIDTAKNVIHLQRNNGKTTWLHIFENKLK